MGFFLYISIYYHLVIWRLEKSNSERFLGQSGGNETEDWLLRLYLRNASCLPRARAQQKNQTCCKPWLAWAWDSFSFIPLIYELILSRDHIWSRSACCGWATPGGLCIAGATQVCVRKLSSCSCGGSEQKNLWVIYSPQQMGKYSFASLGREVRVAWEWLCLQHLCCLQNDSVLPALGPGSR